VSATSTFEAPGGAGSARWLQVLLVASLAVNLLIAGAVLGGAWVAHHHPAHGGFGHPAMMPAGPMAGPVARFVAGLPPERRAQLRDVIAGHQGAAAEFNKSLAANRRETFDAMLAVPFDRAKLELFLKRLFEAESSAKIATIPANVTIIQNLTDAERAEFVKEMNWSGVRGAEKAPETAPGTKAP